MKKPKILLVDDADTILLMEKMILMKESYDIITAKDGREAVSKAEKEQPDLILMDVMMPHMNGFEACQEIRKNTATQGIPIIMVTTRGEPENVQKGYECGCNDYITKPINRAELLAKIQNFIGE
jgi:DNA-binding response OmpR family regulator